MKALKEGGDLGADQIEWFLFEGQRRMYVVVHVVAA